MRILDGAGIRYEALSYDDDGGHELDCGAALKSAEVCDLILEQGN